MREILSGTHFWYGNQAIAEGAIAAGCRFFAGYPITPASEIAERISERFPKIGGTFIQFEDEIASMAAILGASWSGKKSMTATSGPGISLMQENFGLGVMMEVPIVQVDVQRGSPSTGLPTLTGQGDVMQVKWGSHGPYEIIAIAPSSPQEAFDLTIEAFNMAEKYRVPTVLLTEEAIGHSAGKVVVPEKEEIKERVIERKKPTCDPDEYIPYKPDEDMIPPMAAAGEGYEIHTTGLTHNEQGFPDVSPEAQQKLVKRLNDKIRDHREEITEGMMEEKWMKDAEIAVVAYGVVSGPALRAVRVARNHGIKAGLLRLKVVWPFASNYIKKWAGQVDEFIVPEINYGQIYLQVKREIEGRSNISLIPHMGGALFAPSEILEKIEEVDRS